MYYPEFKTIFNKIKASAKRRKILFTLQVNDLDEIGFPITCPILGIPLKFNRGQVADNSYSFDRIDSSKGYEKDNIVIISWRANRLKSDATKEELDLISSFYKDL
jgi:hypothetical protein